ncbi:MAG: DUF3164 family protein [Lysobacteraceae bacterium]
MNSLPYVSNGHRVNTQGHLVPEEQVREIDKLRDELVRTLIARAQFLAATIAEEKKQYFSEIDAFVYLSLREYGVERGGEKGNVTLMSYDGRYKIVRAVSELIRFDERLQAAKALIDACLNDWTAESRTELRTIVQDAFRVDQAQNIRTQQVLGLRRFSIEDERWKRAMTAISESIQIVGSKSYVRFYERIGNTQQWRQIPLDIATAGTP